VPGTITTTQSYQPLRPDYFDCRTGSCSLHDDWVNVSETWTNSTAVCDAAHANFLSGFALDAPRQCRASRQMGFTKWNECKVNYCQAYEEMVQGISHAGGPQFYGGGQCKDLLAFNRTLCESSYRDAEAFCDCICPTIELLEATDACEADIFAFLLLGRKSPVLAERYPLSSECSMYLCNYFEYIGDSDPPAPPPVVGGVPGQCHALDLPFRRKQCRNILTALPYEPCPWFTPGTVDDVLECTDNSLHEVDIRNIDSWGICTDGHDFRKRCPANYPVMCAGLNCVGEGAVRDACCQIEAEDCRSGEARGCSSLLVTDLPEWHGRLTPDAAILRITTTSLSALEIYNAKLFTTTIPPSIKEALADVWPWFLVLIGVLGLVASVVVCVCLARQPHENMGGMLFGVAKTMVAYRANRVMAYAPSGNVPYDKGRERLPYSKSGEEVEAERTAAEATIALHAASEACHRVGRSNLVSGREPLGPVRAEAGIRAAIAKVREQQLQMSGRNLELIEEGEQWLRTLEVERELLQMVEAARPDLETVGQRVKPLSNGAPWTSTRVGQTAGEAMKVSTWHRVEMLTESLKRAKEVGAGDALVKDASTLLAGIVARVKDLPADRCVLDPGGEGVKLLPQGTQRAVYLTTGDPYLYRPDAGTADDAGDLGLPREELGDVSVDEARAVCAEFAQKSTCRAGKRCPWRHCKPKPGDSVRECIIFEDA